MRFVVAVALILIFLPPWASAHHSRVEFDRQETIELVGEIVDLDWRQPHPAISVQVTDSSGSQSTWLIETFGGVNTTGGADAAIAQFKIGSMVSVAGRASSRRSNYFLGTNVLLDDGSEVILGGFEPRWSNRAVGGDSVVGFGGRTRSELSVVDAASENLGVFRVWSMSEGNAGMSRKFSFTQAAIAARGDWDALNNPLHRCEQPGMPAVLIQPVYPLEFIDRGSTIELRDGWYETERTVHMSSNLLAEDRPQSHLGYSVGHWEDETLVIETTNISWPYFDTQGTTQSMQMHVTERYTLSEDQSRLYQEVVFVDPATFTEPATYQKYYTALGDADLSWECRVLE